MVINTFEIQNGFNLKTFSRLEEPLCNEKLVEHKSLNQVCLQNLCKDALI